MYINTVVIATLYKVKYVTLASYLEGMWPVKKELNERKNTIYLSILFFAIYFCGVVLFIANGIKI